MAKVFVSGQIGDVSAVHEVQEAFRHAGHRITHDWTRSEAGDTSVLLAGERAKFDNPDEAAQRATSDLLGVIDCDIYVICTDNQKAGKGMYVELGAALAMHELRGSPTIYVLGARHHSSIFYFHPSVRVKGSVDEILEEMNHVN